MSSATRFLSAVKAIPARSASFAGFAGPVAVFGSDSWRNGAPRIALTAFEKHGLRSGADFYSEVEWLSDVTKVIERPPMASLYMPALNCGVYSPDPAEDSTTIADVTRSTVGYLTEKGIIPVCLGGGPELVLPIIEGVRQVTAEDFFVFHLGASTLMETESSPLTQVFRKGLCKNFFALGNRGVTDHARRVRREHQVRYFDNNALYQKGIFTVKDIRNQYPAIILVDIGVMDPAFAPGVRTPESGGFTVRDVLHCISILRGVRVMGILIAGFEPDLDVTRGRSAAPEDGLTALVISKLLKELINKAYTMSVTTAAEGQNVVLEYQNQGKLPPQYPE